MRIRSSLGYAFEDLRDSKGHKYLLGFKQNERNHLVKIQRGPLLSHLFTAYTFFLVTRETRSRYSLVAHRINPAPMQQLRNHGKGNPH